MPALYASFAIAIVFVVGCGPATVVTVPVSGKVTFKGKPCGGALVVFHPQDEAKLNAPKPVATTSADGTYQLTLHEQNDGAEPGKYAVTIVWNVEEKESKFSLSAESGGGTDRLKGKYGNPQKPQLSAEVEAGKLNEYNFALD